MIPETRDLSRHPLRMSMSVLYRVPFPSLFPLVFSHYPIHYGRSVSGLSLRYSGYLLYVVTLLPEFPSALHVPLPFYSLFIPYVYDPLHDSLLNGFPFY